MKGSNVFEVGSQSEWSFDHADASEFIIGATKLEIIRDPAPGTELRCKEPEKRSERVFVDVGADSFQQYQQLTIPDSTKPLFEFSPTHLVEVDGHVLHMIKVS